MHRLDRLARADRPVSGRPTVRSRATQRGATTSEYLVIAGVVVAIVIGILAVFSTQIRTAITTLGCRVQAGAGGSSGSCGGAAAASGANAAASGAVPAGQLVPVGSSAGGPPSPGSLAGGGSMAPGGPTVTPGFGTALGVAGSLSPGSVWNAAGEVKDTLAAAVPNPFPGGSDGLPVKGTVNATTARYGNWIGQGWWGGSALDDFVGAMPPADALDALGQAHDFGYAMADEAERLYGPAEGNRLRALADEIGYRAWQQLDPDPTKWNPPPADIEAARDYYNRFPTVMQGMGRSHENARLASPPPTPDQLAALQARGPITATDFEAMQQQRIADWNVDRGVSMRNSGRGR